MAVPLAALLLRLLLGRATAPAVLALLLMLLFSWLLLGWVAKPCLLSAPAGAKSMAVMDLLLLRGLLLLLPSAELVAAATTAMPRAGLPSRVLQASECWP